MPIDRLPVRGSVEALAGAAGGRFSAVRRLGEGSMGVVYEVVDRETGTRVALKTLGDAEPGAIYHLKNEFRALTDLVHPNLVTLHELVVDDVSSFFTMELVDGVPFDDYVRVGAKRARARRRAEPTRRLHGSPAAELPDDATTRDPLPTPRAEPPLDEPRMYRALLQLAAGIAALHDAGKLHRDLKPSNVLVTVSGVVKILDFGLVSDDSQDPIGQTVIGRLAGTPAYMAPEQASGDRPTPASDWYAFGVMIYEVLTGAVPFDGPLYELLFAKQHEKPALPSLTRAVPAALEALCMQLLSVRASERPSAVEILARLREMAQLDASAALSAPPPPTLVPVSGLRPASSFVGRERELSVLHELLAETECGEPRVAHLVGVSGIGKSALATRFSETAAANDDTIVLRGRCFERESVPYKGIDGIIDALSRHLRRLLPRDVLRVLPRNVHALCRVFPVLARVETIASAPRRGLELPVDPAEQRRLAWSALRDLLGRVADETPLVLCIDDFQWADRDSAQLLAALLAPPDPPPLMLLLTYRSEERRESSGVCVLLEELAQLGVRERTIELAGLREEQVAELVAAHLPGAAELDAQRCFRESEGNPFLVHELLRQAQKSALEGRVPCPEVDLDAAIAVRVDALPDEARRLLVAAALAARPTHIDVLAAAAGAKDARAGLRKLQADSLVRTSTRDARLVETYHDRLREAIVRRLSDEEQRGVHRKLSQALLAHDGDPETLAEHFLAAGDPRQAYAQALRAAPRAANALSFDRAARFYCLAIELAQEVAPNELAELHLRHAESLASAGRCMDAAGAYETAAEHSQADANGRLRLLGATQLLLAGRAEDGMARLDRALATYGVPPFRDEEQAREHIVATITQYTALAERLESSIVWRAESELSQDELTRLDVIHAAALGLAWLDMGSRYFALAIEDAKASLEAREPLRVLGSGALLGALIESVGGVMPAPVASLVAQANALVDDPRALAWADYARGASAYFHSRFQEASDTLAQAEETFRARCRSVARELTLVRIPLAISLRWSGRLREVMSACERWGAAAREQGDVFTELWMQLLDISLLCEDRPEDARARIEDSYAQLSAFIAHGASASTVAVVRLIGQVRRAEADWYEDAWESAYANVRMLVRERGGDSVPLAQGSGAEETARVPLHSMQIVWHRARAFCGAVAARGALDAELSTELDEILALQQAFAIPMMSTSGLLHAAVALSAGDRTEAASLLLEEARYSEQTHGNHERAACYRLKAGGLLGGAQGEALFERAEVELRALGVRDPVKWAGVLAPGF